tara:strand:- start:1745 stop:2143 length:399 start_codon:yes stop_codon:yes gene_type:complete
MHDFSAILAQYGFTPDQYDFESTIAGFDYDLQFALLDQDSGFDTEKSNIIRQWNNPSAYLRCELITRNSDTNSALTFFLQRWVSELRYNTVTREILDITQKQNTVEIRALLISPHNAMTFEFHILPTVEERL